MSTFTKILQSNHVQLRQLQKKSISWFEDQVNTIKQQGRISPYYLMRGASEQNRSEIRAGDMFMFYYDAKHKDTLPYWDRFPLVFPFRGLKDGFIGLNLHYLPYHLRAQLLTELMNFKTSKRLTEYTRLNYSWATIQNMSRHKLAEACVHRYLSSQVRSVFKKVNSPDWATAMLLPVEQFVGATKQKVWKESLK